MFSGIIKEVGRLRRKTETPHGASLEIASRWLCPKLGESVSVNGVCLTVTKKVRGGFCVDTVEETLLRTNLGGLAKGALLNLEPSLRLHDGIDGHLVSGHVDTMGKIIPVPPPHKGKILAVSFPKNLKPFIAEKGSIALNGVSLTVTRVKGNTCHAALIPFTLSHTNLSSLKSGDLVNIEVDLIARYVHNSLHA